MTTSASPVPSRPARGRRAASILLALGGLLWVCALAAGFAVLWSYKSTPAEADQTPPERWPAASQIARTAGRPTLVMFVHPKCPCTRASVAELGRLMARLGDTVSAHVRVLRPPDAAADWNHHTSVWDRAAAVPGVTVQADADGVEAARFHAVTSGQTLLYDRQGRLAFNGGLTAARGHEGDSFGRQRILALVTTGRADRADAPVFGCSLIDSSAAPAALESGKDGPHEHQ
jgi:hypothetical protein